MAVAALTRSAAIMRMVLPQIATSSSNVNSGSDRCVSVTARSSLADQRCAGGGCSAWVI